MADESEKPEKVFALVHVDTEGLSVAAKAFVDKISDAISGVARPWQIRRIAEAESDAKLTEAQSEIRISSLQRRAAQRWLAEEEQKQANIESISAKAVPEIKDDAKPDKMDPDWLVNFFDKSRLTSDEEMQAVWAKILAGEANAPGKFAKRTVNLLGSLDKNDAEQFQSLCRFNWRMAISPIPLIFDTTSAIYAANGINWIGLKHLDEIGLVSFDDVSGMSMASSAPNEATLPVHEWLKRILILSYGADRFMIYPGVGKRLSLGHVKLSRAGGDLASIFPDAPVAGYLDWVLGVWRQEGAIVKPMRINEPIGPKDFGFE